MEIERKFTVRQLPEDLARYDSHLIEQGYLNTNPVVRVRREDNTYYLTYKGKGLMAREEYNLPLNEQAYNHLVPKPMEISLQSAGILSRFLPIPSSWMFLWSHSRL